eukprot:m51a1_g9175 hypothetical protein (261) ;mRNA; r:45673-46703
MQNPSSSEPGAVERPASMPPQQQQQQQQPSPPQPAAKRRRVEGDEAVATVAAGDDSKESELRHRAPTARFAQQFQQMVWSESSAYRRARDMKMTVATGRLVDRMPPYHKRIVVTKKMLASPRRRCVLVVSPKRLRCRRGVCGLVVFGGGSQGRGTTWLFVAEDEPVELPASIWASVAAAMSSPGRAVGDDVKDEILDLFGIPSCPVCPITLLRITGNVDAVRAPDGQIYQRDAIEEWLKTKPYSPWSFKPMVVHDLVPYH